MDEPEIYIADNSDLAVFESENKGYRLDVYVCISNEIFKVSLYEIQRLMEDYNKEMKFHNYFLTDPNLIIVKSIDSDNIALTIKALAANDFFSLIKPIKRADIDFPLYPL